MNKYTVYIIRTDKNTLYTGQTNDLGKRFKKHQSGKGAKYLRAFNNFRIVYQEEFKTLSEALKREYEIKQMTKKQKEVLVKKLF